MEMSTDQISVLGDYMKLGCKAERFSYAGVYVREGGRCCFCGEEITNGPGQRGDQLQFHHVVALEDQGPHVAANVKPAHALCHQPFRSAPRELCGDRLRNFLFGHHRVVLPDIPASLALVLPLS